MRLYLDGENTGGLVVALDVSDFSEAERQTSLADARILYPAAQFFWHQCAHDESKSCRRELA